MHSRFMVEGEARQVAWEHLQLPFSLRIGEQSYRVVHHRPGFCLLEDGRCLRYSSLYLNNSQEFVLQLQGQTLSVKAVKRHHESGGSASQDGLVKSPMNGVVVKLSASHGQQVESGQVLLVLEAMKMENEVTAPFAGKLTRLEVTQGQVVGAHQILFEVQAEA